MTQKFFLVAGTSVLAGLTKVRFANDMSRVEVLAKNDHTDINLVELDAEMTKPDACKFLLSDERFQGEAEQTAIKNYVIKNAPDMAVALELIESPEAKAAAKAAAKKVKDDERAAEKAAKAAERAAQKQAKADEKAAAKAAAEKTPAETDADAKKAAANEKRRATRAAKKGTATPAKEVEQFTA